MSYDNFEDFQYDSCVSRGICSINPRNSALQTVLVLYLRLFAKFAIEIDENKIDKKIKDFILNVISITIYNPEFNEDSFNRIVVGFKVVFPKILDEYNTLFPEKNIDDEKSKLLELFDETEDIVSAIQFGEKKFNLAQKEIPSKIRDLYNIMLVITKSLSINILDLNSFEKSSGNGFKTVLNLLSKINIGEADVESLKEDIFLSAKVDKLLMKSLREAQEERYGKQSSAEVSYSTMPAKAVLVVGSNLRELETVLEALKNTEIDVYTHDDMMLAHTFPKFSEYQNLKGQFGHGMENCLLDFATFPGPIILTKHSLHNIENFYRGRLFTTDYATMKGVINLRDNDFSEVIESALQSKGFKTGKNCESVEIGYNYDQIIKSIEERILNYNRVFIIALEGFSLEQKAYFEKLIKFTPSDTLIISFSYDIERENLIYVNTCFDSYSMLKFYDEIKKYNLPITVFVPKCDKNSISQMIYLSENESTDVFVGKCTPIILNPSLMNTLQEIFQIKGLTTAKKDVERIIDSN